MYQSIRGLKNDLKEIKLLLKRNARRRIIKKYFEDNPIKKIHLGSDVSKVEGWLCSDLAPRASGSIYLDVSKKFPFKDESVHYIYSEHMIEHLVLEQAAFMLKECYRVLKPGGKIRLATPDFTRIMDLYNNPTSKINSEYVKWISTSFLNKSTCFESLEVVNQLFHGWKHQFLYDQLYLSKMLNMYGFTQIKVCDYLNSEDEHFRNLETHHLNVGNLDMVKFETLIVEAIKK